VSSAIPLRNLSQVLLLFLCCVLRNDTLLLWWKSVGENSHLQMQHMAYSSKCYKGLLSWDAVCLL